MVFDSGIAVRKVTPIQGDGRIEKKSLTTIHTKQGKYRRDSDLKHINIRKPNKPIKIGHRTKQEVLKM